MVENSLPQELCAEILLRLPVEALVRFRSVCKSWLNIISSTHFINDHLTRQNTSVNTNKYLLFNDDTFFSLQLDENPTPKPSLEINFSREPYSQLVVYGTCNGLVCLSHDCMEMNTCMEMSTSIYLWNPVVRKIKILPIPRLIFDISPPDMVMVDYEEDDYITSIYICFGYHDDDYKVIMVGVLEDICSVGIYSLSTNLWSVVDDWDNLDHPIILHNLISTGSRFVNGVAYFKTSYDIGFNQIVGFDMSCKVIQEIELPVKINEFEGFTIDVYGESLALLTLDAHTNGVGCLTIWFLTYYSDIDSNEFDSSWEKVFVIDLSQIKIFNPRIPVRFINDGKVLVKVGVKFFVCNLEVQEFEEVKIEGMAKNIIDYLGESLALLEEYNVDLRAMTYQRK